MRMLHGLAAEAGVSGQRCPNRLFTFFFAAGLIVCACQVHAAPYASNVQVSGTTVNFILNEPADALTYSINGGAAVPLDGTTKGSKMFTLPSPTATFSITAAKNDPTGYTIGTGGTMPAIANALSQDSPQAGLNIISDEANPLIVFNSPRGVAVSKDPNAPHFGTTYVSNSAAGSVPEETTPPRPGRTLIDEGIYAVRADGSDAFGYGDTAKNPNTNQDGFPAFIANSANSPYRLTVGENGDVFVADYSDLNGTIFRLNPTLTTADIVLAGIGGPGYTPPAPAPFPDGTAIPPEQNHGSISSVHVEGSLAGGDLVVYGVDEDINSAHFGGTAQSDRNSLWRWEVGSTVNSNVTPTRLGGGFIGTFPQGGITIDMERGAVDGKFYLSQNRSVGNEVGILVLNADGSTAFNSLTASRELLGDPAAVDIFRNVLGIGVSPDQQWLAAILNIGDVAVIPLVDGIPDIANRMVVDTDPNIISGRDITFDAAGNIHYVSSGQGRYRVLAPGGETTTTLSWDGTEYSFTLETGGGPGGDNADFDGDGDVDGRDFLTWQRNLGAVDENATLANGNANGDQVINQDDLNVWKQQFSAGGGPVAAVPEPTTWGLAALAALGCLLSSLPRRRLAAAPVQAKP